MSPPFIRIGMPALPGASQTPRRRMRQNSALIRARRFAIAISALSALALLGLLFAQRSSSQQPGVGLRASRRTLLAAWPPPPAVTAESGPNLPTTGVSPFVLGGAILAGVGILGTVLLPILGFCPNPFALVVRPLIFNQARKRAPKRENGTDGHLGRGGLSSQLSLAEQRLRQRLERDAEERCNSGGERCEGRPQRAWNLFRLVAELGQQVAIEDALCFFEHVRLDGARQDVHR